MTRSQKAFRNVLFSTGTYAVQLILSLIVRVFFVRYIGREYLGLNSVYASILSVISIADLGLDTVFVYLLYKPLKTKDYSVINGILNLYKVIYRYITVVIVVVGIIIIPFIPSIIGKQVSLPGTYTIYFLYIMNAAVGYLNAYKRALFIADQNGYIVSGITSGFIVLVDILQIIQISIIPSSVIYMIIQVAGTFFTNVLISYLVKKRYRQVFESNKVKLSENEKSILIHNGIGGISNKIGSIIVVSSDNVLLSIFTNLVTVGMYSNYTVLTAACSKVMQTISTAITPSLGQMGVEHDSSKNKEIFLELSFIIYSFSTFIFVGFFCFITPFVTVWVGKINVFPVFLTWLISINLWMNLIRTPSWMFADSFGLQWIQRWKSVVEAIANLGFSLVFLKIFNLGIEGIILGTILSTILVVLWYEPLTVFKHIIPELTLKKYINFNLPFIWIVVVSSLLFFIGNLIVSHYNSIFVNLINSCITFFITCAIYFVFFRKNKYYKKMINRIFMLFGK